MLVVFFCLVDDTRVILTEIPGVDGSDYINANYIDVSYNSNVLEKIYKNWFCIIRNLYNESFERENVLEDYTLSVHFRVMVLVILTSHVKVL